MPLARLRQGQHTGGRFYPSSRIETGALVFPGRARQLGYFPDLAVNIHILVRRLEDTGALFHLRHRCSHTWSS